MSILAAWTSTYSDLGLVVKGIIDDPTPYLGKEIAVAGDLLNLHEIAEIYTKGRPSTSGVDCSQLQLEKRKTVQEPTNTKKLS